MNELFARVKVRLKNTDEPLHDDVLTELLTTAVDRINLRVGDLVLNPLLNSIAVDLTVKMYRRLYFEGIESEKADTLTITFVDDLLKEYDAELSAYVRAKKEDEEDITEYGIKFI